MRAAVYLRVSTEEQAQGGTSLGTQLERCKGYITSQGWSLEMVESDEGISGTSESRPGLDRLMTQCRSGHIDVLVVAKIDRLSRSTRHFENTVGELDGLGVNIASVAESIDSTTSGGRMLRSLLAVFATFERDQIVERTSTGLRATAKAGHHPGGPPPSGFKIEADGAHKRLVIDETEAEWLRLAVDLIVDKSHSTKTAADALNAMGYKPRRSRRFTHGNLRGLLKNAPLSGTWIYGRTGETSVLQQPIKVPVPEIISPKRHTMLLAALDSTATTRAHKTNYLLSWGRLVSVCGDHHHGVKRADRDLRQYRCNSSLADVSPRCSCPRLNADAIEDQAWSAVCGLLLEPGRVRRMATDYLGLDENRSEIEHDQLQALDRKIANTKRKLKDLIGDYLRAGVHGGTVRQLTEELEGELDALLDMRQSLTTWQADHRTQMDRVAQLAAMASQATSRLATMTQAEKAKIIELLDLRVTVTNWTTCFNCHGRGKVAGGRGGQSCPGCFGTRSIPSLRVEGRVFAQLFDALDGPSTDGHGHGGPSLPFTVVAS